MDGLTLNAARGAVTGILGPNGAGKTTTIEICEGYRRPEAGTVRVLGLDPERDARELRPRVGVMLQSGGIPPSVPAADYLRLLTGSTPILSGPATCWGWSASPRRPARPTGGCPAGSSSGCRWPRP